MKKILIITICFFTSCLVYATSNYQIDLILFAHPNQAEQYKGLTLDTPLIPLSEQAINLSSDSAKTNSSFQLLPPSQSALGDQFYLLNRSHKYQMIGYYSWRQPSKNQSKIALPSMNRNGWQIQGTIKVQQINYYLFAADLQLSPPSNPEGYLTLNQNQRLKADQVYYLDHPQVGMLIKIHKLV